MSRSSGYRELALWATVIVLVVASLSISSSQLPPDEEISAALLRRHTFLGLLITGGVMGAVDPARWKRWLLVVGLAPTAGTILYVLFEGPGNIWPIALAFALFIGLVLASVGISVGRSLVLASVGISVGRILAYEVRPIRRGRNFAA